MTLNINRTHRRVRRTACPQKTWRLDMDLRGRGCLRGLGRRLAIPISFLSRCCASENDSEGLAVRGCLQIIRKFPIVPPESSSSLLTHPSKPPKCPSCCFPPVFFPIWHSSRTFFVLDRAQLSLGKHHKCTIYIMLRIHLLLTWCN